MKFKNKIWSLGVGYQYHELQTLFHLVLCENKLVVLTTERLPWLQTNWRDGGYDRLTLEWKPNCTGQPKRQRSSSSYNHNTMTTLITSVKEWSQMMHFKIAVRNFHAADASRWFPHRRSEGYQCVEVVRWIWQLPLRLPFAISIYEPFMVTITLASLQPG